MIAQPEAITRQFRRMRLFVLVGLAALIVCGVAVFFTHRGAHGTTAEERATYEIGEKTGEAAPTGATLPTVAELNATAQKYFEQQGSAERLQNSSRADDLQAFKHAFVKGYTDGFKKTHPSQ